MLACVITYYKLVDTLSCKLLVGISSNLQLKCSWANKGKLITVDFEVKVMVTVRSKYALWEEFSHLSLECLDTFKMDT